MNAAAAGLEAAAPKSKRLKSNKTDEEKMDEGSTSEEEEPSTPAIIAFIEGNWNKWTGKNLDDLMKKEMTELSTQGFNALKICVDTFLFHSLSEEKRNSVLKQIEANWPQKDWLRVADPLYQIGETPRTNDFDLDRFSERIRGLLQWRPSAEGGEMPSYEAPWFPIVQSSGTGKTRLLFDYKRRSKKENENRRVYVVSCIPPTDEKSKELKAKYDYYLDGLNVGLEDEIAAKKSLRANFVQQLMDLTGIKSVAPEQRAPDEVVLLLDEAQGLTNNKGFLLRCLRWFLRKRSLSANVVAVLAGTTKSLVKLYPELDEETQASRAGDMKDYYSTGSGLLPPFFDIWTMGCLSKWILVDQCKTDYEKAIPYGRPLFARLIAPIDPDKELEEEKAPTYASREISEEEHKQILLRMLLYKYDWWEDLMCHISLLATRVQLGSTHTAVIDKLVSKGYAHLIYFQPGQSPAKPMPSEIDESQPESSEIGKNFMQPHSAKFTYLPDPVCARLAMGMMDDNFGLGAFKGRDKARWMAKLSECLSSNLCQQPRGDIGEVFVALYMLFCGDEFRIKADPKRSYQQFSVSLTRWMERLNAEKKKDSDDSAQSESTVEPTVSFIQVCRNELRMSLKDLCNQKFLSFLYGAACMTYAYEGCPAYDCLGSIRFGSGEFRPLLVSIKARAAFGPSLQAGALLAMIKALEEARQQRGLCLLVLVDLDEKMELYQPGERSSPRLNRGNDQPTEDYEAGGEEMEDEDECEGEDEMVDKETQHQGQEKADTSLGACMKRNIEEAKEGIVARIVRVPDGSEGFFVADMVRSLTRNGDELSEVYASHSFLAHSGVSEVLQRRQLLRVKKLDKNSSDDEAFLVLKQFHDSTTASFPLESETGASAMDTN